jgi:adenylosuccinate synthase
MAQVIQVVTGGQYGSEGKGHVTAQLVQQALRKKAIVVNVRVAGPNAGHTVYDKAGNKFALRQVPVGAAISDEVQCYIAPGSEIEPDVLFAELDLLKRHGHRVKLAVSGEATVLTEYHKGVEAGEGLVSKIGSTGKGIGAARADRLLRGAQRVIDSIGLLMDLERYDIEIVEPSGLYEHDDFVGQTFQQDAPNRYVIVEGTQGYGLGLHVGHYPQVTSSDCRAIDFLSMAGISPWRWGVRIEAWVVARVYPIRVAGNSGPMKGETSWGELGLPEEHTTVTQKVRRVGEWDEDLIRRAVQDNGGLQVHLALTMVDQKFPQVARHNAVNGPGNFQAVSTGEEFNQVMEWVSEIEDQTGAQVHMLTTSPVDAINLMGANR